MDGRSGKWWVEVGLGAVVVMCEGTFMAARAYLVVEVFASVRSLPAGAYDTPDWTEVFPHFERRDWVRCALYRDRPLGYNGLSQNLNGTEFGLGHTRLHPPNFHKHGRGL